MMYKDVRSSISLNSLLNYHTAKAELEMLLRQKITFCQAEKLRTTIRFLKNGGFNVLFKIKSDLALKLHSDYIFGDDILITAKSKSTEYVLYDGPMMLSDREKLIAFVETFKDNTEVVSKTREIRTNEIPFFLIPFIDAVSSCSARHLSQIVRA